VCVGFVTQKTQKCGRKVLISVFSVMRDPDVCLGVSVAVCVLVFVVGAAGVLGEPSFSHSLLLLKEFADAPKGGEGEGSDDGVEYYIAHAQYVDDE